MTEIKKNVKIGMNVPLKRKIALAIVVSYFQDFIEDQDKAKLLKGAEANQKAFLKKFLYCDDFDVCCDRVNSTPSEMLVFLTDICEGLEQGNGSAGRLSEYTGKLSEEIKGDLSIVIIKKQFETALNLNPVSDPKGYIEGFISVVVKEGQRLGFTADEITDFLVEIFHELGYAEVSIPDPKPAFRSPIPFRPFGK